MTTILGRNNSVLNNFIAELRNTSIQADSLRFRRNMERIGEVMAYEISKTLAFEESVIKTPLGDSKMAILVDKIVNATILRAGLPMHQGVLNYFDNAENAFISAYRRYVDEKNFEIVFDNISGPSIDDKILILSDPMLASGASMVLAYEALLKRGNPKHTHIAAIIGAEEGLRYLEERVDSKNVTIWVGDLDPSLNDKKYIVPGLGDAGDLAFGTKL